MVNYDRSDFSPLVMQVILQCSIWGGSYRNISVYLAFFLTYFS